MKTLERLWATSSNVQHPQILTYAQKVILEICDSACFYPYYLRHLFEL